MHLLCSNYASINVYLIPIIIIIIGNDTNFVDYSWLMWESLQTRLRDLLGYNLHSQIAYIIIIASDLLYYIIAISHSKNTICWRW